MRQGGFRPQRASAPIPWEKVGFRVVTVFFALTVVVLMTRSCSGPASYASSRNVLSLGEADSPSPRNLPLYKPQPLSGLSREQIVKMRSDVIAKERDLLTRDYEPTDVVFSRIKDGAAWFSLEGFFYLGPGEHSIAGPSSESRPILNPFLLVMPEFWGLSIWGEANLKWNREQVAASGAAPATLPLYPKPDGLDWDAKGRRATVTYNLHYFLYSLQPLVSQPLGEDKIDFGVSAYNARDFALRWIYLSPAESSEVEAPKQGADPLPISDYLTFRGGLCGNKEGCNHSSNAMPPLDTIKVRSLPAKAVFWLWRKQPENANVPPDFRYVVILE